MNLTATVEACPARDQEFQEKVIVAPGGVSMMDSNGQFSFVNEALAEGLGYQVHELLGRPWIDSVSPEDRPAVLEAVEAVTLTGRSKIQCQVLHRNGRTTGVELLITTRKGANNTDSGLFCFCKAIIAPAVCVA